jgi:predicted short-subunit dehydrogenase-like oxidoreductase (DUF2520 family)
MEITLVGPGRAGMAVALAAHGAGHVVSGILGNSTASTESAAAAVDATPLVAGEPLGSGDLLVIAVRDSQIREVADVLAPASGGFGAAVHLSGLAPIDALVSIEAAGPAIGSFHPLQTLPTPEVGAARLAGAWIGVTADEPLRSVLHSLAGSLNALPFDLPEDAKALYHAGAAAAANFPLASLTMAHDFFRSAGVPFEVARPLVEAVVANAFELGPRAALTGPVARGDAATVAAQLRAVRDAHAEWLGPFEALVEVLARLVGRGVEFSELIDAIEEEPTK